MNDVSQLLADLKFRLASLNVFDYLDIFLVTAAYYGILWLLRRSQAAFLLRGLFVLVALLVLTNLILPLPTFDWIVLGAIVSLIIALPITLQPELRRWLERIGRSRLLSRSVRRSLAERVAPSVVRALRAMSDTHTGALVVLEGQDNLDEIVAGGVQVNSVLTEELLRTVFWDKTPLHDGAVIVRDDRLLAAGCVLPLSSNEPDGRRRYGTRHRAALGLSEVCDALVLVVSEETGLVSTARRGNFQTGLDDAQVRQAIFAFYTRMEEKRRGEAQMTRRSPAAWLRAVLVNLLFLGFAAILALLTWAVVVEQSNPTEIITIDGIALHTTNLPGGVVLLSDPPDTIQVTVRTTAEIARTLQATSFVADASLAGATSGALRVPIVVTPTVRQLEMVATTPDAIQVSVAPRIERTLPIVVDLAGREQLAVIYELLGTPGAMPADAVVRGPQPLVEAVDRLVARVEIGTATASVQRAVAIQALDAAGEVVAGVSVEPLQTRVTVAIRRRIDVRAVGVRVLTEGSPPDGYWLSGLTAEPAAVTLQGNASVLETLNGFVNTLPVDITQARGSLSIGVPLDLPNGVEAVDANGNLVGQVLVSVAVAARQGDLIESWPIDLLNVPEGVTVTLESARVDLLLSGPLPTLREIEQNPDLVSVTIDVASLPRNQSVEVTPNVVLPSVVQVQIVNAPILVAVADDAATEEP